MRLKTYRWYYDSRVRLTRFSAPFFVTSILALKVCTFQVAVVRNMPVERSFKPNSMVYYGGTICTEHDGLKATDFNCSVNPMSNL